MDIPTPADIEEWSQVDFDSLGYTTTEQMQLLIDRAVAFTELVTGQELDTIDTSLEPLAAEAVQRWVEHTAYRSQADIIETAADFDLIVSFSVTGYSENRRAAEDARKAQMIHPWPLLHDLLWNLATDDKKDEWLDTWNVQNAPAFAVTEVDWRHSDDRPGQAGLPGDYPYLLE